MAAMLFLCCLVIVLKMEQQKVHIRSTVENTRLRGGGVQKMQEEEKVSSG